MADRPRRPRRPAAETREHVLASARELFYAHGIHRTGVDQVVAAAGIGPTTLYRLFGSKEELVAAYVEREATAYLEWVRSLIVDREPRDGVRAFMRGVADQVQGSDCRGCPFQIALAELPDPAHPAHRAAVALKRRVRGVLRDLAARAGAEDPELTGDRLMLLSEGSYAAARSLQCVAISSDAIDAAMALLPDRGQTRGTGGVSSSRY
jgi:AcrR family transcriptional regulator